MLRREFRASRRRLLLYGSCMALGIAALVGLHGMRATTRIAIDQQAARLLGGDLRISGRAEIPDEIRARVGSLVTASTDGTAEVVRFASMAFAPGSGGRPIKL